MSCYYRPLLGWDTCNQYVPPRSDIAALKNRPSCFIHTSIVLPKQSTLGYSHNSLRHNSTLRSLKKRNSTFDMCVSFLGHCGVIAPADKANCGSSWIVARCHYQSKRKRQKSQNALGNIGAGPFLLRRSRQIIEQ